MKKLNERRSGASIFSSILFILTSGFYIRFFLFWVCVNSIVNQIFDLRKASVPILRLKGHSQTVASSKWIDSNHIVSSSTDGTLKLWSMSQDARSGTCLRTYSGVWYFCPVGI